MKKLVIGGLFLLLTYSCSANDFDDETDSTLAQRMIMFRCGQTATEFSKLSGQDLEKILPNALIKCKEILDSYSAIPDGMMPYEEELRELKEQKIKKFKKIDNNVGAGGSGTKELNWNE